MATSYYCKLHFNLTEAFDNLDDSTVAAIARAILHYSQGLPVPEIPAEGLTIWSIAKRDLDTDRQDVKNGQTGGRPKKSDTEKPRLNPL